MNESDTLYKILSDFRIKAGLSMQELAKAARMEKEILEELIYTNSTLMAGNFASLAKAMTECKDHSSQEIKGELEKFYKEFVDAYLTEYPDQLQVIINPHFRQSIMQIAEATGDMAIVEKLKHLYHGDEEKSSVDLETELGKLLEKLNDVGRQEAVKRVRELGYIPEYIK